MELYDEIGGNYHVYRRPDPGIARAIAEALGPAESVVNVGAGAGSYEPLDRRVVAVEPSATMIRQRPSGAAPAIQASASDLPFDDGAFAAALAILTVHHWPDRRRSLAELARVSRRRVVILTWDPTAALPFWLVDDYVPEIGAVDRRIFPPIEEVEAALGTIRVAPVLIPHDCRDGFLGAYWRRPHAYLDAAVRNAISTFARIGDASASLARLRQDLEDGTWVRRHGHLLGRAELDLGYRLVVADKPAVARVWA